MPRTDGPAAVFSRAMSCCDGLSKMSHSAPARTKAAAATGSAQSNRSDGTAAPAASCFAALTTGAFFRATRLGAATGGLMIPCGPPATAGAVCSCAAATGGGNPANRSITTRVLSAKVKATMPGLSGNDRLRPCSLIAGGSRKRCSGARAAAKSASTGRAKRRMWRPPTERASNSTGAGQLRVSRPASPRTDPLARTASARTSPVAAASAPANNSDSVALFRLTRRLAPAE